MLDTDSYVLRISRKTIDKLGVKLYDRVALVISELVSNSYDADATKVTVNAPTGEFLATRREGKPADRGYEIRVSDNGLGMTPDQLSRYYLVVGADRRTDERTGVSPGGRSVMGRKGVGKLAPFGICRTIEIISAGTSADANPPDPSKPYQVSHVILNYEKITKDFEYDYEPDKGSLDRTYTTERGTTVILRDFLTRKVPSVEDLSEEIAQRFGMLLGTSEFSVEIADNRIGAASVDVTPLSIPQMPQTRITFSGDLPSLARGDQGAYSVQFDSGSTSTLTPGFSYEGRFYPVVGWVGYSRDPVKREIEAGIRIYCRKKFAAQTTGFDIPSGFTGEFQVKSYLIGEIHCDWLDEDEDLIHTDRQNIQWSSDIGTEFKLWGQSVVREIGRAARRPAAESTLELFSKTVDLDGELARRFPTKDQASIRKRAKNVAETLARKMSPGDASDHAAAMEVINLASAFAPHMELSEELTRAAADNEQVTLGTVAHILSRAKMAEAMTLGTIAEKRLQFIEHFKTLVRAATTQEADLQDLIEEAPWLIRPEWTPISENKSLSGVRDALERYLTKKMGVPVTLSTISNPMKRPDFVMIGAPGQLQIVEIKKPNHRFDKADFDRFYNYVESFDQFFGNSANAQVLAGIAGYRITVVADELKLSRPNLDALSSLESKGKYDNVSWDTLIERAKKVHEDFIRALSSAGMQLGQLAR